MSVLGELARAMETATADYAAACNASAEAENASERAYYIAYASSEAESHAGKDADAKAVSSDERYAMRLAKAAEKAAKAKVNEIERRLNAAQSYTRFVREQT